MRRVVHINDFLYHSPSGVDETIGFIHFGKSDVQLPDIPKILLLGFW